MIAESFERIHRSNLVGMGVLPLVFKDGMTARRSGSTAARPFDISGPRRRACGRAWTLTCDDHPRRRHGATRSAVLCRVDTLDEVDYYRHGGILQYVLRQLLAESRPAGRPN